MKRLVVLMVFLFALCGCGSWGDYTFKSDTFGYKISFPENWEILDRSDGSADHLIANLPDDKFSEIIVTAQKVSPDVGASEIYLRFLEGGNDAVIYKDYIILDKGTISAKNLEGRFIKTEFVNDKEPMQGFSAKFLGNRFTLEVNAISNEDMYVVYEADFKKMISLILFKD